MPRDLGSAAHYAEVHTLWPRPDMSILAAGRRAPPTMPGELFGALWPLVGDLAEAAGAPRDYVGLGVLITAASLIGGKRKVRPYVTSDWSEPCILWGAVVGDPSANKSPALDRVTNPLRAIEQDAAGEHTSSRSIWQAEDARAKAERAEWEAAVKMATKAGESTPEMPRAALAPVEPMRRRPLVQDATPEAMGAILAGNPAGTLHLRDELAGWLESFERYSPGGRTYWLEAYGGRPYVVDRVKSGGDPIVIPFNGVSVLGGIQPERLSDALLAGADDGLVSRFLWAWPDKVPFSRPRACADAARLEQVYRRLDGLAWSMGEDGRNAPVALTLEPDAADLFDEWQAEHDADADEMGALYKGMVGKLRGTVLRLSLVSELLRWAIDGGREPQSVSLRSVAYAAAYADSYAKPAALRVFGDASLPKVEKHAATLGRWLRRHKPGRINLRTLRRESGLPGLKDADALKAAVDMLVEAEWLRPAPSRAGDTAGRARSDYLVNPAIVEGV